MYKKNFYKEMRDLKGVVAKERNREMGEFWLQLKSFLTDCNYTNYKYAKELVDLCLEGYNDLSIAMKLSVEEGTIRTHKRNLSNILYGMFGDDFFELFVNFKDNKQELQRRMKLATILCKGDYLSKLLPLDVLMMVRDYGESVSDNVSFSIQDCKREIGFLARYNFKAISEELNKLNKDKLGYLISSVEGERPFNSDLYNIISYIEGGVE